MLLSLSLWQFMVSLAGGTFLSFLAVRPSLVGRRYFFYHGLMIGVVVIGLYFWQRTMLSDEMQWGFLVFLIGIVTVSLLPLKAFWHFSLILLGAFGWSRLTGMAWDGSASTIWLFLHELSAPLLLGFTMAAMLLGHWYLVQPKLPIDELKRTTLVWLGILGFRCLTTSWLSYQYLSQFSEIEIYRHLFSTTEGLFLLMRVLWGLVFSLTIGWMVWSSVRIRSTQSATGLLYVAVLSVTVGEILHVFLKTAWKVFPA